MYRAKTVRSKIAKEREMREMMTAGERAKYMEKRALMLAAAAKRSCGKAELRQSGIDGDERVLQRHGTEVAARRGAGETAKESGSGQRRRVYDAMVAVDNCCWT